MGLSKRTTGSVFTGKKAKHKGVPDDIISEILINLPVKTLTRFMCVSKFWYSLMSCPSFQRDYNRRHLQQDPLLVLTRFQYDKVSRSTTLHLSTHNSGQGTLLDNNFSIKVSHEYFNIVKNLSCQGLICICDMWEMPILVCNPSTREIIRLPPTSCFSENIGFGYAASTKEFKVVSFFYSDTTGTVTNHCEVLTLGTNDWREAKCPPQYQGPICLDVPFLQGAIHLLPLLRGPDIDDCIYAFDIQTEEYTTIPLPETPESLDNIRYGVRLKEFGGSLCLQFDFRTTMELWLLKGYNRGEWVKEYIIDFTSLGNIRGRTLASMGAGGILMSITQIGPNGDEFLYYHNPRDKTFTQIAKGTFSTTFYYESFLSLEALCNLEALGNHKYQLFKPLESTSSLISSGI